MLHTCVDLRTFWSDENKKLILSIISIPDSLCNLHVDDHHHSDQSTDCHDVRHIPENTGIEMSCLGAPSDNI